MSEEIKSEELKSAEAETTAETTAETIEAAEETTAESTSEAAEEAKTAADDSDYDEVYSAVYKDILEHLRSFSPSDEIAYRVTEEHITEYLEGTREEHQQEYKERCQKRFLSALKLIAVLVTVVLIVWFLKDSQAILVNILYIICGLVALWIWKYPHDKDE